MQALAQELERNNESLISTLLALTPEQAGSASSSVTPSSSTSGQHDLRRTMRRFDKCIEQMHLFWFSPQPDQPHTNIDLELLQVHTPLLVDLVTLGDMQAAEDRIRQDVIALYQQMCFPVLRLLTLVDISDEQVDSLVDLAANKLAVEPTAPYSGLLIALLQTIHERLEQVPTLSLLSTEETIQLVSFLADKCTNDCSMLNQFDNGCHNVHRFLLHLLHHLVTSLGEYDLESIQELLVHHGATPQLLTDLNKLTLELAEQALDYMEEEESPDGEKESSTAIVIQLVQILTRDFMQPLDAFLQHLRLLLIAISSSQADTTNKTSLLLLLTQLVLENKTTDQKEDEALGKAAGIVLYHCTATDIVAPDVLLKFLSKKKNPWIQSSLLSSAVLSGTVPPEQLAAVVGEVDCSPWNAWLARQLGESDNAAVQSFAALHAV